MKNLGKEFEKIIKESAKKNELYFLRLQDNLKFGGKVEGARFTQKSPYDGILFNPPKLYCLELKSVGGTSLSYGDKPSCNIKNHQIKSLNEASVYKNIIAGFLIQFREREVKTYKREETVFFINIIDFDNFIKNNDKKSISFNDCKKIGIEIPKINIGKRKIRYIYDLEKLN